MSAPSVDKLNEKDIIVDAVSTRTQGDAQLPDDSHKPSRKESLSGYFTIAAAAFGLIR